MKLPDVFTRFSRPFWVVNTLEMIERGAYYGMIAALPYHLVYNLHFPTTSVGLLLTLLTPFLYILPIISGALAQRYGFRPIMVPAFIVIAVGYALAGTVESFELMLLAFAILGMGTGTFKPLTSGTIACTTTEETRNLGYSIYYWMINVGSFLLPLTVAVAIPKHLYGLVFYLSSALMGVNFAIALVLFKNPVPPDPSRSVSDVLLGAGMVLKDFRFVALLLIYSGFWFMYAINNAVIILYMVDFKVVGDWFPPAMLAVVNPITILAVGLVLGKVVEKYDSLRCMVAGISLFIIGILTLGLFNNMYLFFIGIILFSIGEFVTHPTYISYVSKIAPKEKVAVYMGYAFIPAFIGYAAGNVLVALLYTVLAEEAHQPQLFWSVIASVGLATIAGLLFYSQTLGKKPEAGKHRFWDSRVPAVALLLVIPGLLGGAYSAGAMEAYYRDGNGSGGAAYIIVDGAPINITGTADENTESIQSVEIEEAKLVNLTFTLRWTDEEDMVRFLRTYENRPDEFALAVTSPNGTSSATGFIANVHGQEGVVSISYSFNATKPGKEMRDGTYEVTVACGACGDFFPAFGVIGFTDTGNDWTLEVSYSYFSRK